VPDAVPVAVGHDLNVQGQAADYGAWAAYHLAGTEAAQPVLPFDPFRHRATIIVSSSSALASFNPTPAAVTNPGALTTITSQFLPAGSTPCSGKSCSRHARRGRRGRLRDAARRGRDRDQHQRAERRLGLRQEPVQVIVPAGGAILSIININANAAAVYQAGMVITQDSLGVLYVGTMPQCQQKLGGVLQPGTVVVIENNQQLFMAPDGANPLTVSVLTERWDNPGN